MLFLCIAVSLAIWLAVVFLKMRFHMQILQLEGYKGYNYAKWVWTHPGKVFPNSEMIFWGAILLSSHLIYYFIPNSISFYGLILLWIAANVMVIYRRDRTPSKKPLAYTGRVIRLIAAFKFLMLGTTFYLLLRLFLGAGHSLQNASIKASALLFAGLTILTLIIPLILLTANLWLMPLERVFFQYYFYSSRKKVLSQRLLTVIGITGSFGKTSSKYILHNMLARYFPTLMTPESYNTPMGVSKVIQGQLTPQHKFFVVEMGARKPGDIREMCNLVRPRFGIITAVGAQHMETFKSVEAVMHTKYELVQHLRKDGLAALNFDDPVCRKMAEMAKTKRPDVQIRSYGIDYDGVLDLRAKDITIDGCGLAFTLIRYNGEDARLKTCLLGRHNVYNILGAATIALECGLGLSQIADAMAVVEAVPHRLQLIKSPTGVFILDDAYNSNPKGAEEALRVLHGIQGGRKIMDTPGMVELGEQQAAENRKLGKLAAYICDMVILVGQKQTEAIAEGLCKEHYAEENLKVVDSLVEATEQLKKYVQPGDVVLFENDLPDNYNE